VGVNIRPSKETNAASPAVTNEPRARAGSSAPMGANVRPSNEMDAASMAVTDGPHADMSRNAHVGAKVRISIAGNSAERQAPTALDMATFRSQAKDALVSLGWKPAIARSAVAAAVAALGPETTLERLIFESLRRCPMPHA
jgi:hypothetical protein